MHGGRKFFVVVTILALLGAIQARPAQAVYPDYGPYPVPMNDAAHQDEPNRYHFQYQNYNLDGTWKTNPVIALTTPPIDVSKFGYPPYIFKTLTTNPAITITDPKIAKPGSYTVYSAVPTKLTVAGAYNDTVSYYPPIPTPDNTTAQPHWNLWNDLYFFNSLLQLTGDFPGWPYRVQDWDTTRSTHNAGFDPYNTPTNTIPLPAIFSALELNYQTTLDFYRLPPLKLNSGNPFDLNNPAQVTKEASLANPGETVKVIHNTSYFVPYALDSSAASHNELSANVMWIPDIHMNDLHCFPWGEKYHVLAYGWGLDSGNCNVGLPFQNLDMGGDTKDQTISNLAYSMPPFNFWLSLVSNKPLQYKKIAGSSVTFPVGVYSQLILDYVTTLKASGGPGYPYPPAATDKPTWLQHGAYFPVQPMAGFQRNLIRWYTAWGGWNLINNTSDLFVRSNGDVEIPLTPDGTQAIPLVTQTWWDQNYVIINNTDLPIPATTATYPGEEVYFPANTFFPGAAGVMNAYRKYMIFGNLQKLVPRTADNWLGIKGDTMEQSSNWAYAPSTVGPELSSGALITAPPTRYQITACQTNYFFTGCKVGDIFTATTATVLNASNKVKVYMDTDPGGQANKPYMYSILVDEAGLVHLEFKTSNSAPVAIQPAAGVANKLYAVKIFVDGTGSGTYKHMVTFNHRWQPKVLLNSTPIWQASTDGTGAIIPSVDFLDKQVLLHDPELTAELKCFKATSMDSTRAVQFDPNQAVAVSDSVNPPANTTYYYEYVLAVTFKKNTGKVLMVFENAGTGGFLPAIYELLLFQH